MTETPPPAAPEPPAAGPSAPPPTAPKKKTNGLAIAGLVLGIVAVALFCVWKIALPCAVVGVILSVLGLKKAKETGSGAGMAKAGLVLGIVAIGLNILAMIFLAAAVLALLGIGSAVAEHATRAQTQPGMITFVLAWLL